MKNTMFLTIFIFVSGMGFPAYTFATPPQDTGKIFIDDPIASVLDSLMQLKFFEPLAKPYKTSKYNFSPDSIPCYDESVYEQRMVKLDVQSPFDFVYNPQVRQYIDMYAYKKRNSVSKMLGMSQLYFPLFEEELEKHNLPLELKYLPIIESALNPTARSRAGATGLWQFMYGTGKLYNLKVTSYVDERSDPYKSTVAACEYLSFLYDMFGDWQIVIAAYNCGPGNINKAIRRAGGKASYWEIRPYLPRETQGYVPAFIAATYVMSYAAEHNLYEYEPMKNFFQVDTIKIKQQISFPQIASLMDITVEELKFLNPQYKRSVIPYTEGEKNALVLPNSKIGNFITNEQAIYNYIKNDSSLAKMMPAKDRMKVITVKQGERMNTIANRYKCTVGDIMIWNNLRSAKMKAGQKLTLYIPANGQLDNNKTVVQKTVQQKNPQSSTVTKTVAMTDEKYKYHTIKNGDSLWILSQTYNVTIDDLRQWNNLGKNYMLHPGQKLKVSGT